MTLHLAQPSDLLGLVGQTVGTTGPLGTTVTAAQRKPAGIEVAFGFTYDLEGAQRPPCLAGGAVLYR
jgi:hypothetical protein